MTKDKHRLRETLFEFSQMGQYLKVTAMDPDTLTEVTVFGPPSNSRELLKRTAMAKLQFVLNRQREEEANRPRPPVVLNTTVYGPNGRTKSTTK